VKHINLEKVHKATRIGSRITTDFKIMVVINKVLGNPWSMDYSERSSKGIKITSTVDYNGS
jgi:hypothetical protein